MALLHGSVADRTGSLAGVTRHDYLPFGEELLAGAGGRTPQQGYSANDNVRQKFTHKERDNETGLDYFNTRSSLINTRDGVTASIFLRNTQPLNLMGYL